ncbi:hypothetical protein L8106_10592 [Lyngbya sp. PCC 8106]|nr:hypothetical protein L8106_10592 [Lyngbya sp. PCC 8106]
MEDWIALYDLNIPPHTKNCRYLLPGCLNILTPKNRQKLAQEPTYFFVKTHHHPYPEYFEGEYVLQIVRHPAQVFTSYHNFIKKYYQSPKSLHDIIHGNIPYGSWSEWHLAWEEISPQLKDRFLQLKFKDVVSNQLKACEEIKNLIGLDYKADKKIPSFDELQKKSPNYYRSGKKRKLLESYSDNELNQIQKLHGYAMEKLNYSLN